MYKINHANIKDWAKNYDGPLFDGILCDPPYHLTPINSLGGSQYDKQKKGTPRSARGFMGKDWDGTDENGLGIAQDPEMWHLLFKLLKPGGHLLAFSGSRTYHRMAVAIEDAGFEIRDMIEWVYGSGFPKSHNIGKAIDATIKTGKSSPSYINKSEMSKTDGEVVQVLQPNNGILGDKKLVTKTINASLNTDEAKEWEGWGTALKPAHEPCVLARKPIEGTVANNVLKHGTGGLNIDECRVEYPDGEVDFSKIQRQQSTGEEGVIDNAFGASALVGTEINTYKENGRFPANLILSYPENEYIIRDDITDEQRGELCTWLQQNL